ncbi:LysR family transcriptional regulator [Marinomonas transparens]|uniref:LysR family transcriptional regulator n=1 Tax=Marinomonas transparens TaxID=2795388 RepID=A0A934N7N0_9GAMM|nr:LysR family transcriptional regulator [Marinomonas transparens]MBJ7539231.1 LysR family transcriptional regulator [Marinomonas transparens]
MDPKHLIYLVTILDKGSITSASEYLSVAQPTLTRAMATLEMQAGTKLFLRSRYGVKSTEMGEVLAREGRAVIHAMNLAKEKISSQKLGLRTELRIATGPLLGMGVMPEILERMTGENPNISLTVLAVAPGLGIEALQEDKFDVLLAPSPDDRFLEGIHKVLIKEDEIGIFCGKNHPLAKKKNLEVKDFEAADWLSLGIASRFEEQVLEFLVTYGIEKIRTKVVFRNDAAMLIKLLSRGRHLAVLPKISVLAADDASLVELNIRFDLKISRDVYMWTRASVLRQPAFLAFEKVIKDVFESLK